MFSIKNEIKLQNIGVWGGKWVFVSLFFLLLILNVLFPTQSDDLGGGYNGIRGALNAYLGYNGRFGEFLKVWFGSYFSNFFSFNVVNALIGCVFVHLFFALIFDRLPFATARLSSIFARRKSMVTAENNPMFDAAVVALIMIFLFYYRGFGAVFLWTAGAINYLWPWTLILLWLLPYRIFWTRILEQGESAAREGGILVAVLKALVMLLLGVCGGWGSELGIVLIVAQAAFVLLALLKKVRLPLWYWAGLLGFAAGWLILYFSPGHRTRASWSVFKEAYKTLPELIAMPLSKLMERLVFCFREFGLFKLMAVYGVLCFTVLKYRTRKTVYVAAIAAAIIAVLYVAHLHYLLLPAAAALALALILKLPDLSVSEKRLLWTFAGLCLLYFTAQGATIQQLSLPYRFKLPYTLLNCAIILTAARLAIPYVSERLIRGSAIAVCAVSVLYASFVVAAGFDMRLKWERMLASVDTQIALGKKDIVVSTEVFHSFYQGYTDWGNPNEAVRNWPDTSYAWYFKVDTFAAKPLH